MYITSFNFKLKTDPREGCHDRSAEIQTFASWNTIWFYKNAQLGDDNREIWLQASLEQSQTNSTFE